LVLPYLPDGSFDSPFFCVFFSLSPPSRDELFFFHLLFFSFSHSRLNAGGKVSFFFHLFSLGFPFLDLFKSLEKFPQGQPVGAVVLVSVIPVILFTGCSLFESPNFSFATFAIVFFCSSFFFFSHVWLGWSQFLRVIAAVSFSFCNAVFGFELFFFYFCFL